MLDNAITHDVIILGAGAAGMMAAISCGEDALARGQAMPQIAILEKNPQPGIKVLVCGGGRCNLTNAGDIDFLITQFGRNGRFLTPALRTLDNAALRNWFAQRGVPTHEEHDGKIYPDSNKASSVVNAMVQRMRELAVHIHAPCTAQTVAWNPSTNVFHVTTHTGQILHSRFLLIAVGGQSYTRMGTTGDGYAFAQALGHAIITPRPAIVPLLCKQTWITELKGLAVADVTIRIEAPGPLPRLATGKPQPSTNDMMFTHFGLSAGGDHGFLKAARGVNGKGGGFEVLNKFLHLPARQVGTDLLRIYFGQAAKHIRQPMWNKFREFGAHQFSAFGGVPLSEHLSQFLVADVPQEIGAQGNFGKFFQQFGDDFRNIQHRRSG